MRPLRKIRFRSKNERLLCIALLAAGTAIIDSKYEQREEERLGERLFSIYQDLESQVKNLPTLGDFIAQARQLAEGRRRKRQKQAKTVTWHLRPASGWSN